jgi:hypothetical protein
MYQYLHKMDIFIIDEQDLYSTAFGQINHIEASLMTQKGIVLCDRAFIISNNVVIL